MFERFSLNKLCYNEQEKLEKKKAEAVEQMKNKIALIHKAAEEKRALIEAKRAEDLLKAEETAAKYRATGKAPKKLLSFFWSYIELNSGPQIDWKQEQEHLN